MRVPRKTIPNVRYSGERRISKESAGECRRLRFSSITGGEVILTMFEDTSPSPEESAESQVTPAQAGGDSPTGSSKPRSIWIQRLIPDLKVAKKIAYGYSLAIGIAVLGTVVGLAIGDSSERQAEQQRTLAYQQQYLLVKLENAVMAVRSHPQHLIAVLENPIEFKYEKSKFLAEINRVNQLLSDLEYFTNRNPRRLATDASVFKDVLQSYRITTEEYGLLIQELWQQIGAAHLTEEKIPAAEKQVLVSIRGKSAIQLGITYDRLADSLNLLVEIAESQQKQATVKLNEAKALRLQIILASMLLSAAIAKVLGSYTSRQIARPIEWVTQVAQRVTEKSNFKLIAPVLSEDEVGALATSLNQLVQWIGEYTHELELARQTLELRVEERTRELTQALQDLRQTQAQLIQSEKMSSLGQLVAGVAHEINNPVNFIHGNLQHLSECTQDLLDLISVYQQCGPTLDPRIQDRLAEIDLEFLAEDLPKALSSMKMGTDRIRQIVLSLRNFSRLDEAEVKAVDLHEGIDSTLLILNHRLKQGISVIKQYGDLPKIACYPAQLNQVFMNILANAIDALEEGPNPPYPAPSAPLPTPTIVIQTERLDEGHIRVRIGDNGPGIPPEIMDKLFDPFFTTKPVGSGTGLGLSICYQIVAKHKGQIQVSCAPGKGTEFGIILPVETPKSPATAIQ